jgi:hypothetical protein
MGTSLAAAILAQMVHQPNLIVIFEARGIAPKPLTLQAPVHWHS